MYQAAVLLHVNAPTFLGGMIVSWHTTESKISHGASRFGQFPAFCVGSDASLQRIAAELLAEDIDALNRGGPDRRKRYAAFWAAREHMGPRTVIMAKTKKGYGLGQAGKWSMPAHQQKKLPTETSRYIRDRFELPVSDEHVEAEAFYRPPVDSTEMRHLKVCRVALGRSLPSPRSELQPLSAPPIETCAAFALHPERTACAGCRCYRCTCLSRARFCGKLSLRRRCSREIGGSGAMWGA